jgi:DNA-binding CsgD family transcriptional regulator
MGAEIMGDYEFYILEDELWCIKDGKNFLVEETQTELITDILDKIRNCYPDAYKALSEKYSKSSVNAPYYQYLMVNRFCRCNFGVLDTTQQDMTSDRFNFEKVNCPMRGECLFEGIICCPKYNSKLSVAESRVMKLVYEGNSTEEIANKLYLSLRTIKNHIKSVYLKLGIHEKSEFIRYAENNKLFNS